MKMTLATRVGTFAGALVLAGCAAMGPEITTDYDANAAFSRYATFDFMEREERGETRTYATLGDQRVIRAVTSELEARGYRRVADNPDLLVNFAMTTEKVQDVRSVPAVLPPPWYGWRGGYYYPWPAYSYETRVDTYQRGTLYIDLIDAERRQLVWEGTATGRVTKATREDPAGALEAAVGQIFERYPFRAGSSNPGTSN